MTCVVMANIPFILAILSSPPSPGAGSLLPPARCSAARLNAAAARAFLAAAHRSTIMLSPVHSLLRSRCATDLKTPLVSSLPTPIPFEGHILTHLVSDRLHEQRPHSSRNQAHFSLTDPTCILLTPWRPSSTIPSSVIDKIIISLATRYEKSVTAIRSHFSQDFVEQWGRVRWLEGGDDMYASSLAHITEDSRDATFIRVRVSFSLTESWLD